MAFLKCIKNSKAIPDGKTVLPISDVQIWLHCADIWDKTYTTISQVLNDQTTFLKLVTTSNADDYMARSSNWASTMCADSTAMEVIGSYDACVDALMQDDTWASAIGGSTYKDKVLPISTPTMTSAYEPSGWAYSPSVSASGHEGYKAFDKNTSTWWESTAGYPKWVFYRFPTRQKCYIAYCQGYQYPVTAKIRASNDNSNWDDVSSEFSLIGSAKWVRVNTTQKYEYYELYSTYASNWTQVSELDFYCREGGVQSWLEVGGITNKSYTTLAEVLADSTTLNALMASSDAVDYLAECPSWASTICANSSAMSAIGANNYCSNALLSDAEWCEAICNSTYKSSVLNVSVPTMTSATAPSGEVFANGYSSNYYPYFAFNGSNSYLQCWIWSGNGTNTAYIGYGWDSGESVKIVGVEWYNRNQASSQRAVKKIKVQGSNDKTTWTDVSDEISSSGSGQYVKSSGWFANNSSYRYYRAFVTEVYDTVAVAIQELQFYGRKDVT